MEEEGPFLVKGKRIRVCEEENDEMPIDDGVTPFEGDKMTSALLPTSTTILQKVLREINSLKEQMNFGSVASTDDLAERIGELEAENAQLMKSIEESRKRGEFDKTTTEKPNFVRDRISKIANS